MVVMAVNPVFVILSILTFSCLCMSFNNFPKNRNKNNYIFELKITLCEREQRSFVTLPSGENSEWKFAKIFQNIAFRKSIMAWKIMPFFWFL